MSTAHLAVPPAPPQAGVYRVILADPPWRFKTWSDKGKGRSAEAWYDCLDLDAIKALPVRDWATENCVLFLWCTWPMIFRAEEVFTAWGFEYSGLAWEWIKYNSATDKYAFGLGYGTRKNLEPCLLGRRDNPKLLDRSVRDFIMAPRREHSRKPDEQYERIERMFAGPRLELFARTTRSGWDAWGHEVGRLDSGAPPKRRWRANSHPDEPAPAAEPDLFAGGLP